MAITYKYTSLLDENDTKAPLKFVQEINKYAYYHMNIDKSNKKFGSKVVEIYRMQPTFKNIMCASRQLDACLFRSK